MQHMQLFALSAVRKWRESSLGVTDGTGWRERGRIEMGERIPVRQSWSAAGGHTFRHPAREWALVIRAWGGEGEGTTARGR